MSSISNGVNSAPLPSPTGVIFFASSFIESLVSILLLLLILISILPIDVDNNDVLLLLLLEEVEVGILVLFGEIYGKGGKPLLRDVYWQYQLQVDFLFVSPMLYYILDLNLSI